jgi:hypothetical protein
MLEPQIECAPSENDRAGVAALPADGRLVACLLVTEHPIVKVLAVDTQRVLPTDLRSRNEAIKRHSEIKDDFSHFEHLTLLSQHRRRNIPRCCHDKRRAGESTPGLNIFCWRRSLSQRAGHEAALGHIRL